MGRSHKKNNAKRKTNSSRPSQTFDDSQEVSFDPDPPVNSGHTSPSSSISDLDRVPSMVAGSSARPPTPLDDPEELSLGRYFSRKPVRWSKLLSENSLPFIEPLISYNRKMARIAPRAFERTPQAQARRERAALLCPCRKGEPMELQLDEPDGSEPMPGPSGLMKMLHLKDCNLRQGSSSDE